MHQSALLQHAAAVLYCEIGDFYIDPWPPVPRDSITHAHRGHACPGSQAYLTASPGRPVLQARVGAKPVMDALDRKMALHW